MKPIIEKYKFPEKLDKKIFETDDINYKKLIKNGLTYLGLDYVSYGLDINETFMHYLHHDDGSSLVIDTEEEEIYLVGTENSINKAKKSLERLIGKLGKSEIVKEID